MRFGVALPIWGYALAFAAAVALAVATYAGARLSPRIRAGLTLLRALALLLLVIAVLRPVRVLPPSSARDRLVPILVDTSRSMRVADGEGPARFQRARAAASALVAGLESSVRPEIWGFGDGATRAALGDLQATAGRSDVSGALRTVAEHYRGRPLGGVIVISDGGDTSAADPATLPPVPVFTVGIGTPRITRDREIVAMSAGEPRLADSTVDVHVSALSTGFGVQPLELTLTANGRPVDVRRLPAVDGAPVTTTFTVSPDPSVPTVYRVSVPVAPGEIASENNTRSVLVEPPGRPRRLLLVEGAPGYEHTFLKRALARDTGLDVDAVIRKGQTDDGHPTFFVQAAASRAAALAAGYPRTRAELFAYDAILFGNVEAAFFTPDQLAATADFVAMRGGGLLVLGGRSFEREGLAGTALDEVLPTDVSDRRAAVARTTAAGGTALEVQLTDDGAAHPATRVGASADDSRRRWAALPPLAAVSIVGGPRAGAQILATTGGADGRPLIAVQRYGQGRAMVFAGEASWRWRMLRPSSDTTYDTIWRQMVRWLTRGSLDAVTVAPLGSPSTGTTETVSVLVRDAEFAPVDDAEVQLVVTAPDGEARRMSATLADAADGRYDVPVRFDDAGVFRLAADARRGDTRFGAAERLVLAGGADPEMADPRLNEPMLQRLAERTGGLYVRPDALAQIPPRLQTAAAVDGPPELRDLWHGGWSLVAIIALLGVEWTWRRRVGLP